MKKNLIATAILLSGLTVNAQMTLEKTYYGNKSNDWPVKVINLELSGYKLLVEDFSANQINIYNTNHSLWKTIPVNIPPGYSSWQSWYVTERLFNTDNSIEALITIGGSSGVLPPQVILINENGNVLQTIDSGQIDIDDKPVQYVGNNTYKLIVYCGKFKFCIYSLPGTIPCDKCGNGLGLGKPGKGTTTGNISNPVPNPSSSQTTIEYTLPVGATSGVIDVYNMNGQKVK
ncbi:MAG: hypothetical protein H3C64_14725, partial [Candidatus Kuenenia stuttgartiensis]|nr:hypothetical protein [Candidatus Kuenenia stuttgartiensis]